MRFKLHFNEVQQKLEINCLNDKSSEIIIPDDVSQHIHYPIPSELQSQIRKILNDMLSESQSQEFIDIDNHIKNLTDHRRLLMIKARKEINQQIINKCKTFKMDNAEHFI